MSAMASQFTSLTIVNSTVYSGADQRKHQSFASLAFGGEFTGDHEAYVPYFLLECSFAQLPWTRNDDFRSEL